MQVPSEWILDALFHQADPLPSDAQDPRLRARCDDSATGLFDKKVCHLSVSIKKNGLIASCNQTAGPFCAVATNITVATGRHFMEFKVSGQYAMVGICLTSQLKQAISSNQGCYVQSGGYMFQVLQNKTWHQGQPQGNTAPAVSSTKSRIGVLLDMNKRKVEFRVNGKRTGLGYYHLPKGKYTFCADMYQVSTATIHKYTTAEQSDVDSANDDASDDASDSVDE